MKKLYQTQWHGINFKEFSTCSLTNIATEEFYDKFYNAFFKKFKNYKDIDKNWVDYKMSIAKHIENIIKEKNNILSIGCGIGIVEDYLSKQNSGKNIVAIEPSKNVSRWLKSNKNVTLYDGYFPQVLANTQKFDFAYANGVDYVFDQDEYLVFLESVVNYGITDFLVISSSSYNIKTIVKDSIKSLLEFLRIRKISDRGQFWGYLRSAREQKNALLNAGFKKIEIIKSNRDTLFIRAQI
jgi:hypothetical protein